MAIIKKQKKSFGEDMEKLEPSCPVGGNATYSTYQNSIYSLQKLKIELLCDSTVLFLGICPKELKSGFWKDNLQFHVHWSTIHNKQFMETTQLLIGIWVDKEKWVPIVAQQKWIWLVSMRMQLRSLASLSGSGIQHCLELWCRSRLQLGSHVAVAVA